MVINTLILRASMGVFCLLTLVHLALAATFFVTPNGSGDCSSSSPCTLDDALDLAGNNDTIRLRNGTYTGFATEAAGVTIEAENTRQATVVKGSLPNTIRIRHNNITVRRLVIDGDRTADGVIAIQPGQNNSLSNIEIVNNHIFDGGASGVKVGRGSWSTLSNVIVRDNLIEDMGWTKKGECIYVGGAPGSGAGSVSDIQIYNNTCRDFTQNGLDLKPDTHNADVHHNIFEQQFKRPLSDPEFDAKPLEGTIVTRERFIGPFYPRQYHSRH